MLAWLTLLIVGGGMGTVLWLVWRANPGLDLARVVDASRIGLCAGAFNLLLSRHWSTGGRALGRAAAANRHCWCCCRCPVSASVGRAPLEARWRREHLAMWALVSAPVLALATQGSPGTLSFRPPRVSACCLPAVWLSQWRHRRRRSAGAGFSLWMMAPSLLILPASLAEAGGLQAWGSLAAGIAVYAACAWRNVPPRRAMLPSPA